MSHARILILESLATISGGQAVLLDLLPALTATYHVGAVVPGDGALTHALQAGSAEIFRAPMADYQLVKKGRADLVRFAIETPKLALFARRLIGRFHANLVYANNSRALVWGTLAAALAHRPILWHIHNLFGDHKTLQLLKRLAHWPVVKCIICASAQTADQLADVPAAKLKVIPNGVDLNRFTPALETRNRFRSAHSIGFNTLLIGIVGDLIPLKGQSTFIEAAAIVHQQLPDVHFWIVGQARSTEDSRSVEAQLQQQAAGLPIDFTGYQADMPAVLNALDVLVVASTTETGPLVLLEGLACGTPVLSTPVGRAPELLADDVCGELFPVGDASTLAQKLIALLNDVERREVMSRAARQYALEQLSLETFRTRVLDEVAAVLH
jgi:glycosyltransferase involved in cell wall biosynthesis